MKALTMKFACINKYRLAILGFLACATLIYLIFVEIFLQHLHKHQNTSGQKITTKKPSVGKIQQKHQNTFKQKIITRKPNVDKIQQKHQNTSKQKIITRNPNVDKIQKKHQNISGQKIITKKPNADKIQQKHQNTSGQKIITRKPNVDKIHQNTSKPKIITRKPNVDKIQHTHQNTSEQKIITRKTNVDKIQLKASVDMNQFINGSDRSRICDIPVLNPFDKSIMKFIKNIAPNNCLERYPLLFETDLESNLIIMNFTQIAFTNCCYGEILREKGADDKVIFSKHCIPIKRNESKISLKAEFIYVSCFNATSKKRSIVDMFGFVHLKSEVESRLNKIENNDKEKLKLNVVILGLDSISHMNFIRTNKNSHKFLTQNLSAIEFHGYNKIADNTFPNVVPLLMGLTEEEAKKKCFPKSTYFDSCPLIWKEFSHKGYRTSYAEDSAKIATFNYLRHGFASPPADYYLRPLMYAQNEKLSHGVLTFEGVCNGPRYSFEVLLDNIRKTAWNLGGKGKPYFQFVWSTALSHDWVNAPSWGDNHFKKTLEWFSSTNRLNDTILILLSDHGVRWGDIRDSIQGRLEEKMPLFYSVFPKWFEEKYQTAMKNYRRNANALTTPFDVYETLRDILNLKDIEDKSIARRTKENLKNNFKVFGNNTKDSRKATRGISLFLPIPSFRDCAMAQIPLHFCVCNPTRPISIINNKVVKDISHSFIEQINVLLKKHPQCFQIQLKSIISAQIFVKNSKNTLIEELVEAFVVSISADPGDAHLEATVQKGSGQGNYSIDLNTISRTNRYGWHAYCVKDITLKKFCYCR